MSDRSAKKVLILGSGPAGVSAALYTARAGADTTVLTQSEGGGALAKAHRVQNYYGFPEGISGPELAAAGIAGAKAVGVKFVTAEAVDLSFEEKLTVRTADGGAYAADAVILATGAQRAAPPIPGLKEREGHGVSYCAVCDAFFYRKKAVAVLGSGEYALHEAEALLPVAGSVALLTNGAPLSAAFPPEVTVYEAPLAEIEGEGRVQAVRFAGGDTLAVDGLFLAVGTAGSTDLARKAGAAVDGTRIAVDDAMATNVPGLFAAGDCTGGLLQVAKAVADGAQAGLSAIRFLRGE